VTAADVVRIEVRLFLAGFVAATDPENVGPRLFCQRVPDSTTTGFPRRFPTSPLVRGQAGETWSWEIVTRLEGWLVLSSP
jgi:hypothetical protein